MSVEALQRAVADLRAGRPEAAERALEALLTAGLPPEMEAPAQGLRAQALLALDRPSEARDLVFQAIRGARALGDNAGVKQLRSLNERVYAALAAEAERARRREETARVAAADVEALIAAEGTPEAQILAIIRKADAEMDAGRGGAALAERAVMEADARGGAREQVFARLCLLRADPDRAPALLERARQIADAANNQGLITAVAKAARAANRPFDPVIF